MALQMINLDPSKTEHYAVTLQNQNLIQGKMQFSEKGL